MNKKIQYMCFAVMIMLLGSILFICCNLKHNSMKEYLHITTLSYRNGVDYDDGVSMVTYVYDIENKEIRQLNSIPIERTVYPVSYFDYKNNKIYHSNAGENETYDNLYVYDLDRGTDIRLTDGKFLFNDFMMVGDDLICNVAPEYATVTQPAIYNVQENTFRYLDENDDDTWCFSLSYSRSNNKLLSLTCSDTEMRTDEVCAVTFIRPKTIYIMNPDFSEYEPVYYTKEFEIRSTRQLDSERIMLAADPSMGGGYSPYRKIKIYDMSTEELTDLDVPELKEINTFYPRDNAEGIYIYGKDRNRKVSIFYYNMIEETVSDIFEEYEFPPEYCGIINFSYSYN